MPPPARTLGTPKEQPYRVREGVPAVRGGGPGGADDLRQGGQRAGHHGRTAGHRLQGGEPEGLGGPGGQADVGGGLERAERGAVREVSEEGDGQPPLPGALFEPGPQRSVPGDDEDRTLSAPQQRLKAVQRRTGPLLDGQPGAHHEQGLVRARVAGTHRGIPQRGVPPHQVDAQRGAYDVAGADADELALGELRGAHDT